MTRRAAVAAVVAALVLPSTVLAYLPLSVQARGRVVPLTWKQSPIRWFASDAGGAGISAAELQATANRAFGTWQDVPTASVSFQFVGFTGAAPGDDDGIVVLGFDSQPDQDRTLAATSFLVDTVTGELVEADIFFNAIFPWSTTGAVSAFDLQSVATHEIGHLLGLGHSALGETELLPGSGRRVLASGAVMFPIAFGRGVTADRVLQPDDIAGVSSLYPDGGFGAATGSVQGRVRLGGRGVFGAHVVAFSVRTGAMVGGFSLGPEGEFSISGLTPGPHVIRVEPLDDASPESFFDDPLTDTTFRPAFYERVVLAPAGGSSASFDVTVQPK